MELTKDNSMEILIDSIEKETDHAVFVKLPVSWNGTMHTRSFWFPKSCTKLHDKSMEVATFVLDNLSQKNRYHGYYMSFETGF